MSSQVTLISKSNIQRDLRRGNAALQLCFRPAHTNLRQESMWWKADFCCKDAGEVKATEAGHLSQISEPYVFG